MTYGNESVAHWPADTDFPLTDEPVGAVLCRQAAAAPDRPAVVERVIGERGATLTATSYGELRDAATSAARCLLQFAEPGDRIAVWAPNSVEWVIIEYASALAGLVLVPLNPALTDTEAAGLIARAECVAVFTVREFRGQNLLERAATMDVSSVRRLLNLGTWRAEADTTSGGELPTVDPHSPFIVQFTSGTTGAPKGAILSHYAAMNIGVLTGPPNELGDGLVWCNPMPLHHVGGSVCVLLPVLAHAGTVVLMESFDAGATLKLLEQTRATVIGAVPTMLHAMLDHPSFPDRDLGALRLLQIGGSTVAPTLISRAEAAMGVRIVNAYGQSEAPSAAQTWLTDSDHVKGFTIGRPGLHREARIVRPGTGEPAGFDEPGELLIRSPLTMTSYLGDPVQTSTVLDDDGWLQTGDLCSMAPDGTITICGRIRDVIIRGGENVYPAEVEDVLVGHPAVSDVAVVGVPDERWGQQVVAVVRFRPGTPPTWSELEAFAREELAGFKVPRQWRAVDEFPTTASGKIQKFLLPRMFDDHRIVS